MRYSVCIFHEDGSPGEARTSIFETFAIDAQLEIERGRYALLIRSELLRPRLPAKIVITIDGIGVSFEADRHSWRESCVGVSPVRVRVLLCGKDLPTGGKNDVVAFVQ